MFDDLYGRRAGIAQRLGFELDWDRLDNNRASRIACYYEGQLDLLTADTAALDAAARWSAARVHALHSSHRRPPSRADAGGRRGRSHDAS